MVMLRMAGQYKSVSKFRINSFINTEDIIVEIIVKVLVENEVTEQILENLQRNLP